jgi:hypothetical protein
MIQQGQVFKLKTRVRMASRYGRTGTGSKVAAPRDRRWAASHTCGGREGAAQRARPARARRRTGDDHLVVGVPWPKRDRYSCGEVPTCRWKAARTDAGAPSPVRWPMFSTGSVVVSSSSRARSIRASASHLIGDTPVSSRNRRVRVRRDMWARRARVSRSCGSARFSSIQSRSGPSSSPLALGRSCSTN